MKNSNYILTLLLSIFVCSTLFADDVATLYLMRQTGCMKQVTYSSSTGKSLKGYTDFHLELDKTRKAIFRVLEGQIRTRSLTNKPQGTLSCDNSGNFGAEILQKINAGEQNIYLVERQGAFYTVKHVGEMALMETSPEGVISYESAHLSLQFDPKKNYSVGEDLRMDKQKGGSVFLTSSGLANGQPLYRFRSYDAQFISYTDFELQPDKGIVKTTIGDESLLIISEEDKMPLEAPSNSHCSTCKVNRAPITAARTAAKPDSQPLKASNVAGTPAYEMKKASLIPEAEAGFHIVATGESLHLLAKKYETTIENLVNWNELSSDRLNLFQKLRVLPPPPATVATLSPLVSTEEVVKQLVADSLQTTTQLLPLGHTVVKGDNLYRLSLKYHKTVEELMVINNLSEMKIMIGQVLMVQ